MIPGSFRVTVLPALLAFIICGNAAAHSLPGDAQMVAMLRVAGATTFEKVDKVCEKEDVKTLKHVADLKALFKPRTLSVDELCKGLCVKPNPDSDRPSRDEVTPDFMQEMLEDTNTRGKRDLQPNSEQCEIWLTSLDALWQKYRTPLPDILFGRAPGAPERRQKLRAAYKPQHFKTEQQAVSLVLAHPGLMELNAIKEKTAVVIQKGDSKTCQLADGSQFEFLGHFSGGERSQRTLGKHDVFAYGRSKDAFAHAYSVVYRRGEKTFRMDFFHDDHLQCENYGISENVVYGLTDSAIFRFAPPNGKRMGPVLVVSHDGGLTFSENIHPNAREKTKNDPALWKAFDLFGYHQSRFRIKDGQYQLEITDTSQNRKEFLLFTSSDQGKSWSVQEKSTGPTVYQ